MLVSPDDPVPGEKASLRVEPDKAKEIIIKNFLAPIDSYQIILSQDVIDAASDLQLGKINKESLDGARKGLFVLKGLLTRYCKDPQDFTLRERRSTRDEERHIALIIALKRKERFLPDKKESSVTELVIDLRLPFPQESHESLMMAESLRHSAEEAARNIKRKTPAGLKLMFRTNSVYFNPETKRVEVDFNAGIAIDCTHEGVVARGVYYVGKTPQWTDPWSEKQIKESNCAVVANFFSSDHFYV